MARSLALAALWSQSLAQYAWQTGHEAWTLQTSPCAGTYAGDYSNNHFTADCSLAVVPGDFCKITHAAGYSHGSVQCTGQGSGTIHTDDGAYETIAATATPCSGVFEDDEVAYHFTADCSGVTEHNTTCTLTYSAGFADGVVTCDTALAMYAVVPGRLQASPGEILLQPEALAADVANVLSSCQATFGVDGYLRSPTDCMTDYVCGYDDPDTRDWLRRQWPELAKWAVCGQSTVELTSTEFTESVRYDNSMATLSLCGIGESTFASNSSVGWVASTYMAGDWEALAVQIRPNSPPHQTYQDPTGSDTLHIEHLAFVVTIDGACYYFSGYTGDGSNDNGVPPGCNASGYLGGSEGLDQTGDITPETLYSGTWSLGPIRLSDVTDPGRYTTQARDFAKKGSVIGLSVWNSCTVEFTATDICLSFAVNDYGDPAYDGLQAADAHSSHR